MMVYVRLEDGEVFVKEGAVFLEGDESKRKLSSKGDIDRGGSSAFFCPGEVGNLLRREQAPSCQ